MSVKRQNVREILQSQTRNETEQVLDALVEANRADCLGVWRTSLLYEALSKLLQAGAVGGTEWTFAMLEAQDALNAIDLSLRRPVKFPGLLRVPRVLPEASPSESAEASRAATGSAPSDILTREVTVCANCLTAACWQGEFYCEKYKTADITQKTVRELLSLHLEHPSYWVLEDDGEIRRIYEERDRQA